MVNTENTTMKRQFTKYPSKFITAATSYDKLKAIAEGIYSFFEETGAETSSTSKIREYLTSKGYDMSDISNTDIDEAWDIQASWWDDEDETDGPVILSDGMEIADKSAAYTWLREKVEQYGNTYFWDSSLKNDLNKLIERFGNTYFWRS